MPINKNQKIIRGKKFPAKIDGKVKNIHDETVKLETKMVVFR
jgi:hypothetical protein